MNLFYKMMADAIEPRVGYAWIITKDYVADESEPEGSPSNAVGVTGPSTASEDDLARLAKGEGLTFTMYDDDGERYYKGRAVVSGDKTFDDEMVCAGPLDDFGTPNAGATEIRWAGHPERNIG